MGVFFCPLGAFGQEIIAQGDLAADYFYICQSGTFEIFVAAPLVANLMEMFSWMLQTTMERLRFHN